MARIDIGIIGCGNISHSYLKGAVRSEQVRVKSVADVRMEAAEYGVQAVTVDRLLADPDIQIVINLTVPLARAPVSLQIAKAAKQAGARPQLLWRGADGHGARRRLDAA
jgi:predicted dehydrogenase